MTEPERREQGSAVQILLLCGSFFFLFLGVAAVQQFLVPIIMDRTGASRTAASSVFALVYFGGPFWLWLYGYYFQVLREKWCIVLAGMTYTAFGALIYFTHDLRLAILAALVWGWAARRCGPPARPRSSMSPTLGALAALPGCSRVPPTPGRCWASSSWAGF